MKGEDTKESWCRLSCQAKRRRSSKHRNRGGGLRGVYRKFLFLCKSVAVISHSPHGGRDFLSHFEASQLKEDATAYERQRHLGEGVRAMIGAPVQTAHDNGRRHLREGVWATI
jgi:hypothetical protein